MAIITLEALGLTGDTDTGELLRDGQPAPGAWPDLVRWLREASGLSSGELARRVGTDGRNVRRWVAGEVMPDAARRRLLLAIAREVLLAR